MPATEGKDAVRFGIASLRRARSDVLNLFSLTGALKVKMSL